MWRCAQPHSLRRKEILSLILLFESINVCINRCNYVSLLFEGELPKNRKNLFFPNPFGFELENVYKIHDFTSYLASFPRRALKFIIVAGLMEKGYLFILVNLPERVEELRCGEYTT